MSPSSLALVITLLTCLSQKKHRDAFLSHTKERGPAPTTTSQSSCTRFFPEKEKYSKHDQRQVQLTECIVMFIAEDLLPLSTVESSNFRRLCEKFDPRYQVPSRTHLSSHLIVQKAADIQSQLKTKLSKAQNVCLTLDLWSNGQMTAFLGVTGHCVSDWELKSVMLECTAH